MAHSEPFGKAIVTYIWITIIAWSIKQQLQKLGYNDVRTSFFFDLIEFSYLNTILEF